MRGDMEMYSKYSHMVTDIIRDECFLSFCLDFVYDWPSAVFKDKNFIYLIVFKGLQNGVSAKYELLLMGLHELLNYKRASGEVEKYCAIIFSIY